MKVITIEGEGNTGKTTLVRNVLRWLVNDGAEVLYYRVYGKSGGWFVASLRNYTFANGCTSNKFMLHLGQYAFATKFQAGRCNRSREKLLPLIKKLFCFAKFF